MPKTMSEPIDFIDLTVDSADKYLNRNKNKNRNRNAENIPNNSATTKSRKHSSVKKQSAQLHDSIIEIPVENTCKDGQSMEIIDLDNNPPADAGIRGITDSTEGNLVALTCPICYEHLSSELKPMSTRCGHIFCSQCLGLAMRKSKKCPTCQRAIKLQSCTRLYF